MQNDGYWNAKYKPLSEESMQAFKEASAQRARKRRIWRLIGATIVLFATYGLLLYFVFETFIQALTNV